MPQACEPQEKLFIRFEGSMDTATCAEAEPEVLAAIVEPGVPVVFDLRQVDFISSAFLRLCLCARQRAGDHGFQIVNVSPCVKRVFKIAGLDDMLHGG